MDDDEEEEEEDEATTFASTTDACAVLPLAAVAELIVDFTSTVAAVITSLAPLTLLSSTSFAAEVNRVERECTAAPPLPAGGPPATAAPPLIAVDNDEIPTVPLSSLLSDRLVSASSIASFVSLSIRRDADADVPPSETLGRDPSEIFPSAAAAASAVCNFNAAAAAESDGGDVEMPNAEAGRERLRLGDLEGETGAENEGEDAGEDTAEVGIEEAAFPAAIATESATDDGETDPNDERDSIAGDTNMGVDADAADERELPESDLTNLGEMGSPAEADKLAVDSWIESSSVTV